jgi:hypothetical protein
LAVFPFPQAFSHIGLVNTACIIEEQARKWGRPLQQPAAMH